MKKIVGYLMIILLFAGSVCGVVFGVKLLQANQQIDDLYTQEEVQEQYKEYINQINEKNVVIDDLNGQVTILVEENEQHETTISSLQNSISEKDSQIETLTSEKTTLTGQIETLNSQIFELNSQIETLSEDKENNLAQIEELQSEKSALETQVATLTASVGEKEQTIQTLTADKSELEEEVSTLTETVSQNETTISGLNSQITELQNQILTLQAELEAYEDMDILNSNKVTFMDTDGETIVSTYYLPDNRTLEYIPTIENTYDDWFYGWNTMENQTSALDLSSYIPTSDVTFYPVIGECVNVRVDCLNDSSNSSSYRRYGKDLTVEDILRFGSDIDFSNENIILKLTSRLRVNSEWASVEVNLNTKLSELMYGNFRMDVGGYIQGYILSYGLYYNYTTPETYFPDNIGSMVEMIDCSGLKTSSDYSDALENVVLTINEVEYTLPTSSTWDSLGRRVYSLAEYSTDSELRICFDYRLDSQVYFTLYASEGNNSVGISFKAEVLLSDRYCNILEAEEF